MYPIIRKALCLLSFAMTGFMKRMSANENRVQEEHFIGEYFYGRCIKLCKEHPHDSIHHQPDMYHVSSQSYVPSCLMVMLMAQQMTIGWLLDDHHSNSSSIAS